MPEPPCDHNFVFLRNFMREVSWHHFVLVDVFHCSKCLAYREVEREKEEPKRW